MLRALLLTAFIVSIATPADAQKRHHRGHHGGYHQHHRGGGGFAGGVVGGIIGGVIGGAISNQQQFNNPPPFSEPYEDPVAYCMSKFRSYNPENGFYTGYDGRPRRCP